MANLNRPAIMEDELLFSFVYRTAQANGLKWPHFLQTYVWGKTFTHDNVQRLSYGSNNFIGNLVTNIGVDPADFFMQTTLYPVLAPTLGRAMQVHYINVVFRGGGQYPHLSFVPRYFRNVRNPPSLTLHVSAERFSSFRFIQQNFYKSH